MGTGEEDEGPSFAFFTGSARRPRGALVKRIVNATALVLPRL